MEVPPGGGFVKQIIVGGFIEVGKCGLSGRCWSRGITVLGDDAETSYVSPRRWCEGRNGGVGQERSCCQGARNAA